MPIVTPPMPTAADLVAAAANAKAEAERIAFEKAEKEAAEWKAKEPSLVESIKKRVLKALTKDHPNGRDLRVALPGDENRLIHEYAMKGLAPPGLNIQEIQTEHLMRTGKNLGGVTFAPDTSNA